MLWLYDIPAWLLFVLVVGAFCVVGVGGLYATRRLVGRIVGSAAEAQGVDAFIGAVSILYGLIAGLIAVAAWEQYAAIDDRVSQEASAMGALYREAGAFPEPERTELSSAIKGLTYKTMTTDWELQRAGLPPRAETPFLDKMTRTIFDFKPHDAHEVDVQQAAMAEFAKLEELRRQRFHDADARLPGALYAVVLIGGVLTIALTYFLVLDRFPLHIVMTCICSAMIGMVVFLIIVMDRPFHGDVSIGSDDFRQAYTTLMGGSEGSSTAPKL
jgi:hypothetical protein